MRNEEKAKREEDDAEAEKQTSTHRHTQNTACRDRGDATG